MFRLLRGTLVVVALVGVPAAAFAQASIVGTVRDASGAVLPGVTVVPSGVIAVNCAQEKGCAYCFAG